MNYSVLNEDISKLLQLSNKLDNTLTSEQESLELEWYSLMQLNGDVQSFFKLLRDRKLSINKGLLSFMEKINNSISYSMSENLSETHTFDKLVDIPCNLTQNVQKY